MLGAGKCKKGRIKRPCLYYDEGIRGYGFGTCRTVQTTGSLRVGSGMSCVPFETHHLGQSLEYSNCQ